MGLFEMLTENSAIDKFVYRFCSVYKKSFAINNIPLAANNN